ncbi:uncharacterized protein EV420DRAFT_1749537 [Desarmillaria tabescens]|uniref:Uncharacterized protein n=1 Tax=Armillaria tabescens TaxID=1929756 RepID=A0AA39N1N8_ARMTA|nr:uncharacterized protein EV420DRAFT_1749537 [Desarmillaria tabescens]KAK0454233.1 hypothetical protein EV420DRAFT_1749537 [Desarmillaria tabescens]
MTANSVKSRGEVGVHFENIFNSIQRRYSRNQRFSFTSGKSSISFSNPNMSLHSESTPSLSPVPLSHGRIKDLLRCNDPLVEAEKMALHLLVDEAPATLANLDQQIIEMRQTLNSLIQKNQWDSLKKLTALKLLQITSLTHTSLDPSELPQITLPTVTSLRISEQEHNLGAGIISKIIENNILILPSLSTLKVQIFHGSIPSFPLSHQLPNSLTTLIIRDAMESPDNVQRVLQFLETVPYVNTLVIDGRRCSEFFESLTIQPGKDIILPNLRILLFQGRHQPFPDPVILDFLESRCRRDGDDAGGGAVNGKDRDDGQPQWVFLEEIDLSKVELVPQYRNHLDELRQRVRIVYTS